MFTRQARPSRIATSGRRNWIRYVRIPRKQGIKRLIKHQSLCQPGNLSLHASQQVVGITWLGERENRGCKESKS